MARPKKQTVDYFTHDCDCLNKKTLYIIENRFGNDGYACWFKLLEILGVTDGHFYNCNDDAAWEFLLTKTRLNCVSATEILDMLAKLNAIDAELWENKIIWSQNFVDRLSDVYSKRSIDMPKKPNIDSFRGNKPQSSEVSGEHNNKNDVNSPQDDTGNPQTKLKDIKLDNNIPDFDTNEPEIEELDGILDETPAAAPMEQKKNNRNPKHSPEDMALNGRIKKHFIDNYGKFYNYPAEIEGIYRMIKFARQDAPGLPEYDFIVSVTHEFGRLKNSGEKLFANQPCLPSVVSSKGLWPRVIESMKQHNLIRGAPVTGETAEEYTIRTLKGVFPNAYENQ